MVRGGESKISKYNLEEIVLDLFSKGWSYQNIADELNNKYLSEHNDSISIMPISRFVRNKRKQFEDEIWNGNYETATISARDRGMESLNRLGKELELLIELIFRCKGISKGDKNYILRHKREMMNRISNVILDFGYITNTISYKQDAMRQMLLDFSKELDSEARQKVSNLLEDTDWEKKCEEARKRCDLMYKNKDEVKEYDGDEKETKETTTD